MRKDEVADKILDLVDKVSGLTSQLRLDWHKRRSYLPLITEALQLYVEEEATIPRVLKPQYVRKPLHQYIIKREEGIDEFSLYEHTEITDVRSVRGKVRMLCPIMVHFNIHRLRPDGKVVTGIGEQRFVGYVKDECWVDIATTVGRDKGNVYRAANPGSMNEVTTHMNLVYGFQFRGEYEWIVTLGYRNNIHIALPTNALGVREFLEMRDKAGYRRAALAHWVEQHWRTVPSSESMETYVRAHLKGREYYTWGDLDGEIQPSLVALEAADIARQAPRPQRREATDKCSRAAELRMAHEARRLEYRQDYEQRLREMRSSEGQAARKFDDACDQPVATF